jgi:nicotinamidase-related amidase
MIKREDTVFIAIDYQERLMPAMNDRDTLEDKVIRLAKGLQILDIPHIVTQQYTRGIGETVPAVAEAIGEFQHVEKTSFSCLRNQEFVQKLRETGRRTAVVCGIEAHICVQQTVLQLMEEGYEVYVPVDCISSRNLNDWLWAAERMERAGAVVTTYEAILYELMEDSKAPEFKAISAIVK